MSPAQPSYSTIQHFWRALRGCLGHLTFVRSAAILAVALALAMPMRASAQSLAIGSSVGAPGGQAVVTLSFSGEDIHHLQLDIDYDATALSPTSVTAGQGLVDHLLDWAVLTPGVLRVVVYSASCVEPASGPASRFEAARAELATGELLQIAWEIAQDADLGTYPLMPGAAVLSTAEGAPLTAALEPGSVEVTDAVSVVEIPTLQEWGLIGLCLLLFGTGVWVLRRDASVAIAASLVVLMITQSSLAQAPPGSIDAPMVEVFSERGAGPGNKRLAAPATASIPGDADADGTLSTADVWLIVDSILGRGTPPGDPDCNEDGVVDVLDVACVVAVYCADVGPGNLPPALAAISDSSVREREVVAFTATASDPDLPDDTLTWTLTQRPVGATLDKERGTLLWVPTGDQVGTHPFTVQVTDAEGLSDQETFVVTVRDLGGPPVLDTIPEQSVVEGNPLALTANATDPDLPEDDLTYSLTLAPAGMAIEPSNGAISWTPSSSEVGMHDVTVQVSDREGLLDFTSFVATVQGMNEAPVARDDVYEARLGEPLAVVVPGVLGNDSDPNGDPLTALLQDDAAEGALTLNADGHFDYLLEPPDRTTPVELELLCESTIAGGSRFQTNGTVAIGDVDNDGDIEIVGTWYLSGHTFIAEVWIMNAADCSEQAETGAVVEQAGGFGAETHLGLLDIDGDGDLEIIGTRNRHPVAEGGAGDDEHLLAVHHDGTLAWPGNGGSETSAILGPDTSVGSNNLGYRYAGPTFADLDADGSIEIVMPFSIGSGFSVFSGVVAYNAEDGSIAWEFLSSFRQGGGNDQKVSYVADLDLDGTMEVIVHNSVVDHEGALEFELPSQPSIGTSTAGHLTLAIANFDDDAFPELIGRDQFNHYLFEHDGTLTWKQAERNQSEGQITVADLDGDGEPEWAYVTCGNYGFGCDAYFLVAYEADGSVLWSHEDEPSLHVDSFWEGSVNATAFDANRDGAFDLVFRNDTVGIETLFIFDGRDGSVLESVPAKKYSGQQRFVTIADVNGDGHAELITSYSGGLEGQTAVWTGTAANPLPAAPAFRNQWIFNEAYVDENLSIPTNPLPHWLQPGRNGFHTITREPDPLIGTTDSFTYVAHDGALASNLATVTLDILPAGNPPRFLSEPDTLTTRGFDYRYLPRVVDPDLGDTVTFRLTAGPAGMTLDPATGEVRWQPDTLGVFDVAILALDTIGFATAQAYELTVGDPVVVPDVVGLPEATAESAIVSGSLLVGTTSAATHPTVPEGSVGAQTPPGGSVAEFGGEVDLVVSLGPAPEDVDNDGDGFTENGGDCNDGDDTIFPGAPDPPADGVDQDCDGFDGNEPPVEIAVDPDTLSLLEGERRRLTAYAIFADGSSQIATGIVTWASLNPATTTVSASGLVTAVADAGPAAITATRGAVIGTANVTVTGHNPSDDDAPTVEITSPADGESVFGPVDVLGTANDPGLVRYEIAISPAGEESFRTIGGGTAPIVGGVLGRLDATLMLNGLYTLRLTVLDAGGNETIDEIVMQVDGARKIGNFTLSFIDLNVPLAGIPLTLTRTYDSRDKGKGDFGIGWRLGLDTIDLSCVEPLGEGWFVARSGFSYLLLPTRSHRCTVSLPGQRSESFEFEPEPASSPIVPFSLLSGVFRPLPGTRGRLEPVDGAFLAVVEPQPGEVTLRNDGDLSIFAPERFRYTTADGTTIVFGLAGVESIADRNGNSVTFGETGISHSTGTTIAIERDPRGRVTAVTDPLGNAQRYAYSASGDLVSHADELGHVTRFFYDRDHGLVRIENPLGESGVRTEYDDEGRLVAMTDAAGNRTTFDHDLSLRQSVETDPAGQIQVLAYDESGNVLERRRTVTIEGVPTPVIESWEYDATGNETASVDSEGARTETAYDADGNRTALVIDPTGEHLETSFSYDDQSNLVALTDPAGATTIAEYDGSSNFTAIVDPSGARTELAYDGRGLVIRLEEPSRAIRQFEHDAAGNVTRSRIVDPAGGLVEEEMRTYDAMGRRLSTSRTIVVDGLLQSATTVLTYDAVGNLIAQTDGTGAITRFEYDALGRRTAVTDPLGHRTESVYDAVGNVIEIRRPDGISLAFEYDELGRQVAEIDALGHTTRHSYDELGRRVETVHPDGAIERWVWSPAGRLLTLIDAAGHRIEYEHDDLGRRTRATNALGASTSWEYDAAGRMRALVDPLGGRIERTFDSRGRVAALTFPDGTGVAFDYDSFGRPVRETDELGRTTEIVYDGAGRPVRVVDPIGGTTGYFYDPAGHLISRTDANGHTTRMEYDLAGRPIRVLHPNGGVEIQSFDAAGRLTSFTTAAGGTIAFELDALGRRTRKILPSGEQVTYGYDAGGRLTSASAPGTTVLHTYDVRNRLVTSEQVAGTRVDYTYDEEGNVTAMTSVVGGVAREMAYAWNAVHQLAGVAEAAVGTATFVYDDAGRMIRATMPNGTVTDAAYDPRHRLVAVEHRGSAGDIASFTATRDAVGDVVRIAELGGAVSEFAYDGFRRLVEEIHRDAGGTALVHRQYGYDAVGNRTSIIDLNGGGNTTAVFDTVDRLLTNGSTSFSYDDNGNLVRRSDGATTTTYAWDAENRLRSVTRPSGTTQMEYDALGRRIRRAGPSGDELLVLDALNPTGLEQVIDVVDPTSGSRVAAHGFGFGPMWTTEAGTTLFHHRGLTPSVRLGTDVAGAVADRGRYSAFGETLDSGPGRFGFGGEPVDPDTGLYHLRARFYDPGLGRFLSRDPFPGEAGDPRTFHPYAYAFGNPLAFADPEGLFTIGEFSISNAIRGTMQLAKRFGRDAKALCAAKTAADTVEMFVIAGALAFDLMWPGGAGEVSVPLFTTDEPRTGPERKLDKKLGEENDVKITLVPFKPELAFEATIDGSTGELKLNADGLSFAAKGGGAAQLEQDLPLVQFNVCGTIPVASLDVVFESSFSASLFDKSSPYGVHGTLEAQASLVVKSESLKIESKFPFAKGSRSTKENCVKLELFGFPSDHWTCTQ